MRTALVTLVTEKWIPDKNQGSNKREEKGNGCWAASSIPFRPVKVSRDQSVHDESWTLASQGCCEISD